MSLNFCQSGSAELFMSNEGFWYPFGAAFPIYQCRFHVSAYEDALFRHLNISFHPSLNKAVAKRKAGFLAGRCVAKQSLMQIGIQDFTLDIGVHGNPLWPIDVVGSISHSNDYAMALALRKNSVQESVFRLPGVGIDVEPLVSCQSLNRLADAVLNRSEQNLASKTGLDERYFFTLAFSLKESFFKAAYPSVGRYFDFDAVHLCDLDITTGQVIYRIKQDLTPALSSRHERVGYFTFTDINTAVTLVSL